MMERWWKGISNQNKHRKESRVVVAHRKGRKSIVKSLPWYDFTLAAYLSVIGFCENIKIVIKITRKKILCVARSSTHFLYFFSLEQNNIMVQYFNCVFSLLYRSKNEREITRKAWKPIRHFTPSPSFFSFETLCRVEENEINLSTSFMRN